MSNRKLPIVGFRDKIVTAVRENPVTVITAETGAGKSTQVPQYLLDEGYDLVVTQPRRLAARTVAARVAEEIGEELGRTVGYRTAVDRQDSPATRCLFCTDGLALVRELMGANKGVLVLDEVHEWNENIEVLVAWAKRQITTGVAFKVVLMSATMEAEKLSAFFNNAPVISVPGRLFPVESRNPASRLVDDVVALVAEGRNVLVFQPGKQEITDTASAFEQMEVNAEILPLHGELDPSEQAKCFKHYSRPKVVVSTNVAQTSVTIDDIDAVVDSGMERRIELVDGVEGLYLKPISLADATQRKGRAGRTKAGIYIDHCSSSSRPDFPVAEILRKRLDQTVLRLAIAGFDMELLEFFHQPKKSDIHDAHEALVALGCMTQSGEVTKIGRLVNRLPVSVQYARMLVEADRLGVVDDVLTVAAIMEQGGITVPPPSRNQPDRPDWRRMVPGETESDVMGQLSVWQEALNMTKDDMREKGVSLRSYFRAKEVRKHLGDALRRFFEFGSTGRREDILKAVCAGMVDHLYKGSYGRYTNGEGIERELGSGSLVRGADWLVAKPFDLQIKTRRGMMTLKLVELASKVDPMWLTEVAPQLVSVEEGLNPRYDCEQDSCVSMRRVLFNGHQVKEEIVPTPEHEKAAEVFVTWLSGQVANSEIQKEAERLNHRVGAEVFKIFSRAEIEKFLPRVIGEAVCMAEVNPEAIKLPELDKEEVDRVLAENPDVISIVEQEFSVEYRGIGNAPRITIKDELATGDFWTKLPDVGVLLPGGREVEVVVKFDYWTSISDRNIPALKEKVRSHLNQKQWDNWSKPVISLPDFTDESAIIPEVTTAEYGRCVVVTGEALLAYGVIACNTSRYYTSDPYFKPEWIRDRSEAERKLSEAKAKLESVRAELREKAEREAAKAAAETVRNRAAELSDEQYYNSALADEMRTRLYDCRYASLPSSSVELHAWTAKTEALIAEVEGAVEKAARIAAERAAAKESPPREALAAGDTEVPEWKRKLAALVRR